MPASGLPQLRFLTCGSVDDGKSSLIGRLLYDSGLVPDDQYAVLGRAQKPGTAIDLSHLVDGLQAEREQGITIDVAYRFFQTPQRAFIVADTPGHEQYTRNMATGASTADVALILVDARKGVLPQTRRHATICHLLGIRHVVLALNKADLVDFDPVILKAVEDDFREFASRLGLEDIVAIPLSALEGDNVVQRSARTPWYAGPTLLDYLESVDAGATDAAAQPFRMPVQLVNRPHQDFRGFAGRIASGRIAVGDAVVVAASGRQGTVARIVTFDGDVAEAECGRAVTLVLAEEVDVARGDVFCTPRARPEVSTQIAATLIWMDEAQLFPGRSYWMQAGTGLVPAQVTRVQHLIDTTTLDQPLAKTLTLNEIGVCEISMGAPLAFDAYADNRQTGGFILIDRSTNATVAAGLIAFGLRRATNIHKYATGLDRAARAELKHQRPRVVWFTGLSGSGKSTIANLVERKLFERGVHTTLLDGDNVRHGLNKDLGFTPADRVENIRRVGEVANLMLDAGLVVLCSFISPFRSERRLARDLLGEGNFVEVFVDAPLDVCIERDPKGLYAKALAGTIPNFTGIGSAYERPEAPELVIESPAETADRAAERIVAYILAR